MNNESTPFSGLSPDLVLDAVETMGLDTECRLLALNSYENKVYQVGLDGSPPVIRCPPRKCEA
jgi:Ser/Thr protein kinase RdoA (MazF antagonist)